MSLRRVRGPRRGGMQGLSLIELMITLVIGLIVIGAVLGLIVSIMRSNNQTIQATRLTQELRATAAIIGAEIRRSRGVNDPLAAATYPKGAAPVYQYQKIDTSTAGCVRYAYAGAVGGPYHVIRRDATTNKVILASATTEATATCALAGVTLNSANVNITALTFSPDTAGAVASERGVRSFQIVVTGQLVTGDTQMQSITRTITQTVYVRSLGSG